MPSTDPFLQPAYPSCSKTPSFLAFKGVDSTKTQDLAGAVQEQILIFQVEQVAQTIKDAQHLTVLIA